MINSMASANPSGKNATRSFRLNCRTDAFLRVVHEPGSVVQAFVKDGTICVGSKLHHVQKRVDGLCRCCWLNRIANAVDSVAGTAIVVVGLSQREVVQVDGAIRHLIRRLKVAQKLFGAEHRLEVALCREFIELIGPGVTPLRELWVWTKMVRSVRQWRMI